MLRSHVVRYSICLLASLLVSTLIVFVLPCQAQDATSGEIVGNLSDPSGAMVPNAQVTIRNIGTGQTSTVPASSVGHYAAPLLPPGNYSVTVNATGFAPATKSPINVPAGTTTTVNLQLSINASQQAVTVEAGADILQTENASNGSTANHTTVTGLPLTNRNYTQILQLSPGIASQLPNAGSLGRATVDVNVNGTRVADNSYQIDGEDASNLQEQGTGGVYAEAGISIPNPDAIEEFRIQTSQYDATYGRGAGANVDVITKSGTNAFHGDAFEFLRNTDLNANNYFLNLVGQPRPVLNQNQYGGTLGGPILKDKLFFFISYQGTEQKNGQGSNSLQSFQMPLLSNSANGRTAQALGAEFAGQTGFRGGTAIAPDGSNINPVALALLNYKLPDGSYLIPSPQTVQNPSNVNTGGFSSFSVPSTFHEDQAIGNLDYLSSARNRISAKYFWSRDTQVAAFSTTDLPGAAQDSLFENANISLHDIYTISPTLINQANLGYHRIYGNVASQYPVTSESVGIKSSCDGMPYAPIMSITGSFTVGGTFNDGQWADTKAYQAGDQISWVHGAHNIRMGGDAEVTDLPFADPEVTRGNVSFSSFPDFLLGLSAAQNGTAYSNISSAESLCGNSQRNFKVNDYDGYFQDDIHVAPSFTINAGLRWDIYGQVSDSQGRFADFWPQLASNVFPASGQSYSGFVVPSNYQGTPPAGVFVNGNKTFAGNPIAWNNLGPRLGYSWQVPKFKGKLVLRGGYGIYYGRTSISDSYQFILDEPFEISQTNSGTLAAQATFQNPWTPGAPSALSSYPNWVPRTQNSTLTLNLPSPTFQAPMVQQYTTNIQYAINNSTMLQVGYVGTDGTRIEVTRNINQPTLTVNPNAPGASSFTGPTITASNIQERRRFLGMSTITQAAEIAVSNYNSLQVSLQKRMVHGLQYGVSYTYSKDLTNASGNGTFPGKGSITGDAYNLYYNYGPADFATPQRLVANMVWDIPYNIKGFSHPILSGWSASGVVTLQSGTPLTLTSANSGTIYSTSGNAQICPGYTYSDIVTPGRVESKINNYFNTNAVTCLPNAIGNGYGWGDMGHGAVLGPGVSNLDMSIMRSFKVPGPSETNTLQFRAEFYNAFNTAQFSNPSTTVTSSTFGTITSTSVNSRLIQFGLKYLF
ncbi:MAG TPA: TonB-dependent receptor [Bryobacteraceae bacterium]|nr:TonB-dependent receptor [Bryobacteraceae bacterium]